MIDLRHAPAPILAQALDLNAAVAAMTSPLDPAGLARLLARAAAAPAAVAEGRLLGFLIGFGPGSDYESPNYRWFAARLARFAYVDRVIVAPQAQGAGLARRLYAAFAAAVPGPMVCEVNTQPPNPGSDAFHARLGFAEMGRARLGPGKAVRYLVRAEPAVG